MPSSPSFHDYTRTLQRFFYRGICLLPQDALPEGKVAWAKNVRSYMDGTVGPRYGINLILDTPFASPIHSIFRLNDTTPYALIGAPERRILGVGVDLFAGTPGSGAYGLAQTGFSGDPLSAVAAPPYQSPRPWLYIADSAKMVKIDSDLTDQGIGLVQPSTPPSATLAVPQSSYLNTVGTAAWQEYGGAVTPVGASPTINRVNTVVTVLLYDSGVTGMASVSLTDMTGITEGATVDIGAASETVIVDTVHPAVSPTTIAAILYDVGNTGLCTIQPTGGFSVGQIEAPLPDEIRHRYEGLNQPLPPRVTVNRTVDFPVNSLVLLGGVETVRILSVAIGPDGVQSFRCATAGTFVATDAISGIPSFRAYFQTTKVATDPAVALALEVTLTPPSTAATVGGVQSPISGGSRDWGNVGLRATQPDDIITFGLRVSAFGNVDAVRLLLNVSDDTGAGGSDFLHNYYVYEWRASDLKVAIQSSSPATTGLMADAQQAAVFQGQIDKLYANQYGQGGNDQVAISTPTDSYVIQPPVDPELDYGSPGRVDPHTGVQPPAAKTTQHVGAPVAVGASQSRQMSVGDNQWMTLQCRVGDLTRVGTDTTLTLSTIIGAAILVQVSGSTNPVVIDVTDCYLRGGYGPDVGKILPPYVYRYRYRDNITGARSNPSPPMRAGVTPRRGRVALSGTQSGSSDVVVDWFRFGGALAKWAYVGTGDNDNPPVFNDDMSDSQIDGGEPLRVDLYQPWPISDLPREGTCSVAGTAVEWVSGDTFDPNWAADSAIIINGRATTLYGQPQSTTRLYVVDNCGSGTVPFMLPSPTLLAQPFPTIWGGPIGNAWFHFAVGDPSDPGALHWTHANDPDTTSDANYLVVTSASEPLQNGFFLGLQPFVFSSERLYEIRPNPGGVSAFQAFETPCRKGLWSRWFYAVADEGVYFGTEDGICLTSGGVEQSITDADLRPLFKQDGSDTEAIRNLYPVDMTQTTKLKLAVVGRLLYFDYVDTAGDGRTLVYDRFDKAWTPDAYLEEGSPLVPVGITARISEPGPQVYDHILGAADGNLYEYTITKTTDVLENLYWAVWTVHANGADPRAFKQWGDAILDMHPGGSEDGITVTPVIDNGNVALTARNVGVGGLVRDTFLIEVGSGADSGYGVLSRNFGLWIEGAVQACDTQRPLLYLWEPSYLWKQTSIARRATDWEDLGYKGAKFVQGVVIRANTFGEDKCVAVEYDGPNGAPQQALILTINHDGEQSKAYPLGATGWTPFIGELVRLRGLDDDEWLLQDWRFVFEPAPEEATQWQTQETTFDLPGFMSVRDGVMAYQASAPVNLRLWHDLVPKDHTLPATGSVYQRIYVPFQSAKGKAVRFAWTSEEPFRIFKRDVSVRVQGWGLPNGYMVVSPFGGPHREDGAGV